MNREIGEKMILNIHLCYTRSALAGLAMWRVYSGDQGDNSGSDLKDEGLIRPSVTGECAY